MEIYYLFIKEYNQFRNCDINFGGEFRFFYDAKNEELKIQKNEHYIEDFFEPNIKNSNRQLAKISNVSCVVGENGVGKSTLLNFIKTNLINGVSGISTPIIIAFKDSNGDKKIVHFNKEIPINKCNSIEFNFNIKTIKFSEKSKGTGNRKFTFKTNPSLPHELQSIDYIYFSNVFDSNVEIEYSGLYNLSTNYMIRNDKRHKFEMKETFNLSNEVDTHLISDVRRQVNLVFLYKNSKKYIPFDLPEFLLFNSIPERNFVNNPIALEQIYKNENPNVEFINKLLIKVGKAISSSTEIKENTLLTIYTNCIINFLNELHINYVSKGFLKDDHFDFSFSKILKKFEFSGNLKDDLLRLLIMLKADTKQISPSLDGIIFNWINSIAVFFEILDKYINETNLDLFIDRNANRFYFNAKTNEQEIEKILDAYLKTYIFHPHLEFKWSPSLSSGELSLLNLFARLYSKNDSYVNKLASNAYLKNNIILLIDEPDVYQHPSWSQKIVQSITDFISDAYFSSKPEVKRTIQIIFTSNSPFIIADLPSSNIVFLKRTEISEVNKISKLLEKKIVTTSEASLEDKKETFGANIHTLLTDSFFLPNGSLGEFAKNKMNKLIEVLNSPKKFSNKDEKEKLIKMINIIGEPIVKRKLLQMFNDRFNIDIDERIKVLEEELLSLKKDNKND